MELKNSVEWAKYKEVNTDSYSKGVVVFAERWANTMEACMATGERLEDIAKQTSHEADTEGITGFMYGCAVSMLAEVWKYGESLRKCHNLDIPNQ